MIAIPHVDKPHPLTGVTNAKFAIWLFLASEMMLFGAFFSTLIILRTGSLTWPIGSEVLDVPLATLNTVILITSSVTIVMAWASLKMEQFSKYQIYMALTILLSFVFLFIKYIEYSHKFHAGNYPATSTFYAIYFAMTGLHGLHVIGGIIVNGYLLGPGRSLWRQNPEQYTGRVECAGLYWHFVDLVWIFLFPAFYLL